MFLWLDLIEENCLFSICTTAFSDQSKLTLNAKTENKNVNSVGQVFKILFFQNVPNFLS